MKVRGTLGTVELPPEVSDRDLTGVGLSERSDRLNLGERRGRDRGERDRGERERGERGRERGRKRVYGRGEEREGGTSLMLCAYFCKVITVICRIIHL